MLSSECLSPFSRGFQTPSTSSLLSFHEFISPALNVYPYHLLVTTNHHLPPDVDRQNLEKHLTENQFEILFQVDRDTFYSWPFWKRAVMKRKLNLF